MTIPYNAFGFFTFHFSLFILTAASSIFRRRDAELFSEEFAERGLIGEAQSVGYLFHGQVGAVEQPSRFGCQHVRYVLVYRASRHLAHYARQVG